MMYRGREWLDLSNQELGLDRVDTRLARLEREPEIAPAAFTNEVPAGVKVIVDHRCGSLIPAHLAASGTSITVGSSRDSPTEKAARLGLGFHAALSRAPSTVKAGAARVAPKGPARWRAFP